ncbi:MAG: hypothetical protein KKF48_01125 [Nanoarchaeota archaeon]|nr:hypothetical protein [Nanoarchaeota archaeon]MBU1027625.1 hypothetical protein [Nanoarchaeota archaeon]
MHPEERARIVAMRAYGRGTGRSINFKKRMVGVFILGMGLLIIYGAISEWVKTDVNQIWFIIGGIVISLIGLWRLFKKYPRDYGIGY